MEYGEFLHRKSQLVPIRRVQRQIAARRQLSAKAIARREGLSQAAVERIARGDLPKFYTMAL